MEAKLALRMGVIATLLVAAGAEGFAAFRSRNPNFQGSVVSTVVFDASKQPELAISGAGADSLDRVDTTLSNNSITGPNPSYKMRDVDKLLGGPPSALNGVYGK